MSAALARGMRVARYASYSFTAALLSGIAIAAVAADNPFAQIFIIIVAAVALWLPFLFLSLSIAGRRDARRSGLRAEEGVVEATAMNAAWSRLIRAAPDQRGRIEGIQRSLATSHSALRIDRLNPEATDLCVLIDRRLPDLIDRHLDSLPDDRSQRRVEVDRLIVLVEEFAGHCRGQRSDSPSYEAEVLRRRFEQALGRPGIDPQ